MVTFKMEPDKPRLTKLKGLRFQFKSYVEGWPRDFYERKLLEDALNIIDFDIEVEEGRMKMKDLGGKSE